MQVKKNNKHYAIGKVPYACHNGYTHVSFFRATKLSVRSLRWPRDALRKLKKILLGIMFDDFHVKFVPNSFTINLETGIFLADDYLRMICVLYGTSTRVVAPMDVSCGRLL